MISLRPVLTRALLSAMAVLFFALGCGDDPTRPCTFVAAGRLQGVVRMGGAPTDAVISRGFSSIGNTRFVTTFSWT